MVDWLAGKRMKGTSSERTSLSTTALGGTGVGGWVELGRTTLGSNSNSINVSSLADKRYYMVLYDIRDTSGINPYLRLNSDTGTNYSFRYTGDGSADIPATNYSIGMPISAASTDQFCVGYYANYSTKEKLSIQHAVTKVATGAGTAPTRAENVGKHAQTSNPISSFNLHDPALKGFATGSEVVVLGYDPLDSHTNNFWTELDSTTTGSALSTISSGVFTSKKYIWCQIATKGRNAAATNGKLRVGNTTLDTGSNYSSRKSTDGGADGTVTSTDGIIDSTGGTEAQFWNIFIINNASNEKLIIAHHADATTAGAANAPRRSEIVGKWANTSNQIDIIGLYSGGANTFDAGAEIRVWGAD